MDIHILAYSYHWSEESIWNMSISRRRLFSELVQAQKQAELPETVLNNEGKHSPSSYNESK